MDADDTVLPRLVREELLRALGPQLPAEADAMRMLRAIRARIEANPPIRAVRRDEGWKSMAPGIERKVLFDDGATVSWLMRMAPGALLPEHVHDGGVEECLLLEGEVCFGGECYGPGDYMVAARGSHHPVTRTQTGATMFLRTPAHRPRAAVSAALR